MASITEAAGRYRGLATPRAPPQVFTIHHDAFCPLNQSAAKEPTRAPTVAGRCSRFPISKLFHDDTIGADNYGTHKHPDVQSWLKRHPRFHVHFTPTSASWANMVERFFRDITGQRLRRGVFRSVAELEQAITDYLAHHNQQPKPFIWTARASDILEKVKRGRAALENKARSV